MSYPAVVIPSQSLPTYVLEHAGKYGNEIAVMDHLTGQSITFTEVIQKTYQLAGALQAEGLQKGDVVCMYLPNHPYTAVAFLGATVAGALVSMASSAFETADLLRQLQAGSVKYLITDSSLMTFVEETGYSLSGIFTVDECASTGTTSFATLFASGAPFTHVDLSPADLCVLFYSSGTTGTPKGILHSHENIVARLCQVTPEECFNMGPGDVFLAQLSLSFQYGLVYILFCGLCRGARTITLQEYEPEVLLQCMQTHRVSYAPLAPYQMTFLATDPRVALYDLSSLKEMISGGAALPEQVAEQCSQMLNCHVRQNYGTSETGMCLLVGYNKNKFTSAGWPLPTVELQIIDLVTAEPLPAGNRGELLLRSPGTMICYHNNESATASTIDADGWFHTGDLCYADEEGDYYVVDRIKDLISVNGQYVCPSELEAILLQHTSVADCGVIGGVVCGVEGEVPVAYIALQPGVVQSVELETELIEYAAVRTQSFERIVLIIFTSAVPRNASGKVVRTDLRDWYAASGVGLAGSHCAQRAKHKAGCTVM